MVNGVTRRFLLPFLVLSLFAVPMNAASMRRVTRFLFRQPDATTPPPIVAPSEPESPLDQGLDWRTIAMRDENGVIPVGAAYLANVFRRQQLSTIVVPVGSLSLHPSPIHATSILSPSSWTSRGPQNVGGRTRSLLINPNSPNTMYAGAVDGGVWKTTDSGTTWTQLTDFMSNIAITSIAFDRTVADRSVI
jgi:hypothetical protein